MFKRILALALALVLLAALLPNVFASFTGNLSTATDLLFEFDNRAKLEDIENPTVTWKGITLELGNKVIINYAVNYAGYSMEDLTLRVSYVNNEGKAVSYDLPLRDAGSYWMTSFEGLIAPEMRTIVSAAVYHGETRVSQTYEYSIETYAARSKEGAIKQLCTAMIAYGDSAASNFAN